MSPDQQNFETVYDNFGNATQVPTSTNTPTTSDALASALPNTISDPTSPESITDGVVNGSLRYGMTDYNTGTGWWLGNDRGTAKLSIGNSSGNRVTWDGSTLTVAAALSASSIDIPDTTTANSFHVNSSGDTWWGASAIGSAVAKVLKTGIATFTNIIITGGSVSNASVASIPNDSNTDISILEKTWTMTFSVTNASKIAWTSGTITLSNGRTFTISSGDTGTMSALTYIYLDPAVSSTVLQTTTTAATAMGANKCLIGTAQNNTVTASFIPYGPGQPLVDGANIGSLSITAGNIAASTITAGKMSITQLSAIVANLGSITAGNVTLDTAGYVKGGQTDFNTGTGFFLGYSGAAYKFSIGSPTGNYITWDGTTLTVAGTAVQVNTYTSTGSSTWTKPSWGTFARVQLWGAGGSGGKGNNSTQSTGGGGGAYNEYTFKLSDLTSTVTVTVGTGGAAQTSANTNGNNGGDTTFGSYLTAYHGNGGLSGSPNAGGQAGGGDQTGGIGAGSVTSAGAGGDGFWGGGGGGGSNASNGGRSWFGGGGGGGANPGTGSGGTSVVGGAGGAGSITSGVNGVAGTQPGGGGGAQSPANPGTGTSGAGGDGKAIITVY